MARRKYEFRPDKPRSGVLSRLWLTRKQRLSLLKWFLYGLTLVIASVIQDVMLSRVRLFGATTNLVPCVIFLVCVTEGAESSGVFCLLAAMFCLFSGSAPGYAAIPLITALGICAAVFRQSFLRKGFSAAILCTALAIFVYESAVFCLCLIQERVGTGQLWSSLLTALYTAALSPALYPVVLAIGKIGGEIWKE